MASKTIPFVASTAFGGQLFSSLQKVLAAVKAPVTLVQTEAKVAPSGAKHLLAGPLNSASSGELANKFSLNSRVTKGLASGWYPNSTYPTLNVEVVQNLYGQANPAFVSAGGTTALPKALAVKDESGAKLVEIQKETDRAISAFFRDEATRSLQGTVRVACNRAVKTKADRKTVVVVTKPHGDVFDELLTQAAKSEADGRADELRSNSVALETSPVGNVWPKLVMFPEGINQVVCPANAAGDQITALFTGIAGGTGMVSQQLVGDATVYTCANDEGTDNPTGALLATCELLTDLGHEAEAKKITAALASVYADKIIPKELPGGKASLDEFIEAVAKKAEASK